MREERGEPNRWSEANDLGSLVQGLPPERLSDGPVPLGPKPTFASAAARRHDPAWKVREPYTAIGRVLVLSALAARPERLEPALSEELLIRLRDRNRAIPTVFSHLQSLEGTPAVAIFDTAVVGAGPRCTRPAHTFYSEP